jgi:hypothetical protein
MDWDVIRERLLLTLGGKYQEDPRQFVTLPKQTMDSAVARQIVADLRNQGYVEEQVRGVIRLTARGYSAYLHEPSSCCSSL